MTITSSPLLAPDDVARHTFTTVRRGFDPKEVRAYLESLAHGLTNLAQREQQLREDLAATERRAANPVLDEPTLTAALGRQTARVLHSAHEVADEMAAKAQEAATRVTSDATEEADAVRTTAESRAEERIAEAEAAAATILEKAAQSSSAVIESAKRDSDELVARAKEECRAMVEKAQELRARMLADLTRRRRFLHAQIEQLRAGRERLAETIDGVRRSFDGIADDLSAAEDNAREAAELAGRAADRVEEESPEELVSLLQTGHTTSELTAKVGDPGDERVANEGLADHEGGEPTGELLEPAPTEKLDALFAKLRAANGSAELATEEESATDGTGPPAANTEAESSARPAEVPSTGSDPDAHREASVSEEGPPADRPPTVIQRDELVAPAVATLSRRLKRTLQDTQNDILDQLRSNGSHWSPGVMPEEVEQVDGLTTAVLPVLEEAAVAGAAFVGGASAASPAADAMIAIAHQLAEEVVAPLRRRLSDDGGVAEAGEAAAVEHVGAAFREWRGSRVEGLAGDYVVTAFSLGSVTAVERDADGRLEWISVPGSTGAPCPDCEDNGLTGPQPPGEEFPTGHRHPPAHPGCRCLVAPPAP